VIEEAQQPLVLIADDESHAVMLLTRVLERDGFAVASARDGEEALVQARSLRPDLILMDVQMPKLNGFEVVRQLREEPETSRIPIIFVTAAAREPSDVAHGFKLGADDYIRKPYNYHELLARAHSKMQARRLEERLQRRTEELEALVRIGAEFNQRLALEDLIELVVGVASAELGADYAELYLFDDDHRLGSFVCTRDASEADDAFASAVRRLEQHHSIARAVLQGGEPLLIADTATAADVAADLSQMGLGCALATPLRHHGALVGILVLGNEQPGTFSENDLRLLRSIGEQAALAVRNAQLYAELRNYAQNLEEMVEQRTQELRAAQAQLIRSEKLAALGRLAAGIAHEVNNPLQPILNCLEVAIEDVERGELVDTEVLRVAETEVQRIKTIVTRLLDFARPGSGAGADNEQVDLRGLIQEILLLTAKNLEQRGITVRSRVDVEAPVLGNPAQLKQVMLNLVLNAMEAMPDGGELSIEVYPADDGAMIAVTDTGVGMDEETLAQIFDPFYSTKQDGTGLGLAVTYGIVEGHGGRITVESQPGVGTCFSIWLPRVSQA